MTIKQLRYVDRGVLLPAFAERVLVVCPQCNGPALVTCKSRFSVPFRPESARIQCLKCSFSRTSLSKWSGPMTGTIKRRCPVCGSWIKESMKLKRAMSRMAMTKAITCHSCGEKNKFPIRWKEDRFQGTPTDPAYGLQLWLQIPCAGNVLWVYNKKHLQALNAYIASKLRERVGAMWVRKWSMFNRMPQWMKAAKNRESLLRGLRRLEQRLQDTKSEC